MGEEETLQRHAVVLEEAAEGKGERAEHADPADLAGPQDIAQAKVCSHGDGHRQQREDELAERQPEKQAFLIVPDFFVDAYFYLFSPPVKIVGSSADRHLPCLPGYGNMPQTTIKRRS